MRIRELSDCTSISDQTWCSYPPICSLSPLQAWYPVTLLLFLPRRSRVARLKGHLSQRFLTGSRTHPEPYIVHWHLTEAPFSSPLSFDFYLFESVIIPFIFSFLSCNLSCSHIFTSLFFFYLLSFNHLYSHLTVGPSFTFFQVGIRTITLLSCKWTF